jgi:hypothetical protein
VKEEDPFVRRLERNAIAFCLTSAGVALVVGRGRPDAAIGVLAGGLLTAVSYWTLKGGLDAFMRAAGGAASAWPPGQIPGEAQPATGPNVLRAKITFALFKVVGRYALLAFMAYVMIARLRLHVVGLMVGASSIVAAAGIEAARSLRHRAASRTGGA